MRRIRLVALVWAATVVAFHPTAEAGPGPGWGAGVCTDQPLCAAIRDAARPRVPVVPAPSKDRSQPLPPQPATEPPPEPPGPSAGEHLADRPSRSLARERRELGVGGSITGRKTRGFVAFTFDDGPDDTTTPIVLDALERHRVPATFFVVGHRFTGRGKVAARNRAVLEDIVARGHDIGNHTYRHHDLTTVPLNVAVKDFKKNARAIEKSLGHRPYLFRAPYGRLPGTVSSAARRAGYTVAKWNIDLKDFRNRPDLAQRAVSAIESKGGGIVLLHDTKPWTARAVDDMLTQLEALNCQRLSSGDEPIVPTTLHHVLADEARRPVPAYVASRAARYLLYLSSICQFDKPAQAP